MIANETQLKAAVDRAGELLQQIQSYIERNGANSRRQLRNGAIRFPRGFLRTAAEGRHYFSYIRSDQLRSNLAYTMILSDTIHWLLVRTDIYGTARAMLIKLQLFLAGSMVESVTRSVLKGRCGGSYAKRIEYLNRRHIITAELKDKLNWLWEMRNKMHLFEINGSEHHSDDYTVESLNKAVVAVRELCERLSVHDSDKTD